MVSILIYISSVLRSMKGQNLIFKNSFLQEHMIYHNQIELTFKPDCNSKKLNTWNIWTSRHFGSHVEDLGAQNDVTVHVGKRHKFQEFSRQYQLHNGQMCYW